MTIRFLIANPASYSRVEIFYNNGEEYFIKGKGKHWVEKERKRASQMFLSLGKSIRVEGKVHFTVYQYTK